MLTDFHEDEAKKKWPTQKLFNSPNSQFFSRQFYIPTSDALRHEIVSLMIVECFSSICINVIVETCANVHVQKMKRAFEYYVRKYSELSHEHEAQPYYFREFFPT